jgi:phosphonate transport system ATP-binding protein
MVHRSVVSWNWRTYCASSRAGLTVIANLHHVEYARHYADRVLGLCDGRLVFDGSLAELTEAVLVDIFGDVSTPAPGYGPMIVGEPIWVLS